jgi:hydrogenase expression/formation protein HypD
VPQVIAGFEPIDLLMGIWMLVKQNIDNKAYVQNEYTRVVHEEGNITAKKMIEEVFRPGDIHWRGFPLIKKSSLILRDEFEIYDARKKFENDLIDLKNKELSEPIGCRCGELLRGLITPFECPIFGKKCKPESPVGPCMVSIEGSCNIEYRYSRNN